MAKVPSLPAERDREEKAALDQLLPLLTPRQKAFVVADLNDPNHNGGGSVTSVPQSQEAADLLAKIYAIRDARATDERLAEQRAMSQTYSSTVVVSRLPSTAKVTFGAGEIPANDTSAAIRGPTRKITDAERAFATGILNELSHAKARSIPGYGDVPSVAVPVGPATE